MLLSVTAVAREALPVLGAATTAAHFETAGMNLLGPETDPRRAAASKCGRAVKAAGEYVNWQAELICERFRHEAGTHPNS